MARGVNKVILIGNLGRDPEIRYTQDQQPVVNFSLATSESWQDRTTNERRERTEWHRVVCFRRLAEICNEYLRRGSKVYIEGQLQTRSWEQDGQTRYMTEIVAREMQMLDSRGGGDGYGGPSGPSSPPEPPDSSYGPAPQRSTQRAAPAQPAQPPDDDFEDDIPF